MPSCAFALASPDMHLASVTAANHRGRCVIERKWGLMGSGCDWDMRRLQPCHSILLCDCDHSRLTELIAGNEDRG